MKLVISLLGYNKPPLQKKPLNKWNLLHPYSDVTVLITLCSPFFIGLTTEKGMYSYNSLFWFIHLFTHYQNSLPTIEFSKKKDREQENNTGQYENIGFYSFSTKEWASSFYSYHKASSKPLLANNFLLNKLSKSYFNSLPQKKVVSNRRKDTKVRYSANRVYTGRAELEHTNSKLLITLVNYNKKKAFFERKLLELIMLIKFWAIYRGRKKIYIPYYKNRLVHVLKKNLLVFNKWNIAFFKEKTSLFGHLLKKKWINFHFYNYVPMIQKSRAAHLRSFYNSFNNIANRYNTTLKEVVKLEKKLINFTKNIHFNTFLSTSLALTLGNLGITSLLEKLYGKKIKMNLVEKRAVQLNSDVFSSAVALKLRDRKNKVVRILRKAVLQMVKIPDLHSIITFDDNAETLNKNNVINNMKQQVVSGVRFEAAGRLTRRLTAMRAVFKHRHAGSIKNIRSSFNKTSSTMLRGHLKFNSQMSLINSKTRNGTFGLKGWVSSHMFNFTFLPRHGELLFWSFIKKNSCGNRSFNVY